MNNFAAMRDAFVKLMAAYAEAGVDIVDIHAAVASAEIEARVALERTLLTRQKEKL